MMTDTFPRRLRATPPLLRWVFRQGDMFMTCRVDRQAGGGYALVLIPRGGAAVSSGRVTVYTSALDALRQHAAVAAALRDLGWTLVEHTGNGSSRRAVSKAAAA